MITSTRNPKVQWVRALQSRSRQRREDGAFVVEGVRLIEEALDSGWEARLVMYTDDLDLRGQRLVSEFASRGDPIELVTIQVMRAVSDTQTPQGILAVLSLAILPLPETLNFAFIPDGIRDPGNLGTMLRTAAAAGVDAVFLPDGTVDVFAPKVVRSAMGAHFRLPLFTGSWDEIRTHITGSSLRVYLAAAGCDLVYTQADFRSPLALIIGGEAEGAGETARQMGDVCVSIPMPGGTESLNAAAAAAVLFYEVLRQRSEVLSH
jgi:TrmH family RNA methyltransferase